MYWWFYYEVDGDGYDGDYVDDGNYGDNVDNGDDSDNFKNSYYGEISIM